MLLTGAMLVEVNVSVGGSFDPAALLMTLPLAGRRRYPTPVLILIVVGAVATFSVAPTAYVGLIAIMIAAYSVGAYSGRRFLSLAIILSIATIVVVVFHGGLPPLPNALGPFVVLVPLWMVGSALRVRQLRADAFEDRATRLEREQEQATRAAIAEERRHIARELHNVVTHSVSVMVVQAGAARQVLTTSPEQARESLLAVESSGRGAMTELRKLLGLLSDDDDYADLLPQPGVEQLETLMQRVSGAGLPVRLCVEGEPRPLPLGIDLAAYRIVQEALTNALKYSGLAQTSVILEYRESELKVEVQDEGDHRPTDVNSETGHGLIGMRERVGMYGGRLEAGPRLERGYAVRAWLPLTTSRP